MKRKFTLVLLLALALLPGRARANVGETYGFGSQAAALGGAALASGFNAFSMYANPASAPLSLSPKKRLNIGWALIYMDPQFTPIDNVVVENKYVSDKTSTDNVDLNYKPTFGQTLGFNYQILPDFHALTFGMTAFIPLQQLAYIDSGETFVPEYVLYRSRTQRPQIDFGLGATLGSGFSLGFGYQVGFSVSSNATVFLQTTTGRPSTMRFEATMKPKGAPYFGLLYQTPVSTAGESPRATVGAVYRMPVASSNTIALSSGARILGGAPGLDFAFNASSTFYYDPASAEFGGSLKHFDIARLTLQAEYQFWNKFEAPALLIVQPEVTSCNGPCGVVIQQGNNPSFTYRNIWVLRAGEEIATRFGTYRIGYSYRPSMIVGLPTEAGNYLDPARHSYTAGVGYTFKSFLGFNTPFTADAHFAYQKLVAAHVDKSAGNEAGDATDSKIGAPGYDIGGKILGGGVSLTLEF